MRGLLRYIVSAGMTAMITTTSSPARAEEIRYHGYDIDDQHRVVIEQDETEIRVCLWTRGREINGALTAQRDVIDAADPTRYTKQECLLRIRSEVLRPAKPNGLNNPGARYRLSIESVELQPEYTRSIEVDAPDARGALFAEFRKLQAAVEGVYRDVMYYGAGLAARVLSDAGRFPAEVPGTAARALEEPPSAKGRADAPAAAH